MKKSSRKMFDESKVPNDLCPIATKFFDMQVGDWRAQRPVFHFERCVKCGICWAFCPTQCIVEKDEHFEPFLEHCKGCGICAQECPHNAIEMVDEEV